MKAHQTAVIPNSADLSQTSG